MVESITALHPLVILITTKLFRLNLTKCLTTRLIKVVPKLENIAQLTCDWSRLEGDQMKKVRLKKGAIFRNFVRQTVFLDIIFYKWIKIYESIKGDVISWGEGVGRCKSSDKKWYSPQITKHGDFLLLFTLTKHCENMDKTFKKKTEHQIE